MKFPKLYWENDETQRAYEDGFRHGMKVYCKTAYEWLKETPPRKIIDYPQGVFDGNKFFDNKPGRLCYYPITDTEPCSLEEAEKLSEGWWDGEHGLVWWRELNDAEKNPQILI